MRCLGFERAVRGQRFGEMFAAIFEGPRQGQFAVATDEDCALQMSEIEQKERFVAMTLRDERTRMH